MKALLLPEVPAKPSFLFMHMFLSGLTGDVCVHCGPFATSELLVELAWHVDVQFFARPTFKVFMAASAEDEPTFVLAVCYPKMVFRSPTSLLSQFLSATEILPDHFLNLLHRLIDPFQPPLLVHGSTIWQGAPSACTL